MSAEIILASTSRYRRELLARLRVPFRAVGPNVDETSWQLSGELPRVVAEELALAKAKAVHELFPDAVVIGSDQLVSQAGKILGKPGTRENARRQLAEMAGKEHELITAVVVIHGATVASHTDVTRLALRPLTREEIARYVDADDPVDCAGSYKFESLGISLFERVETADPSAITGLPLLFVAQALRRAGVLCP